MNLQIFRFDPIARVLASAFASMLIASCGSGAVSGPPTAPPAPGPISISPAEATLYSEMPTTFLITGGNGAYVITSSNQAVLPNVGEFSGNSITVVPTPVAADTPITLSVRDTASSTPASAALTVKPRTVGNTVTVTPSASQSAACGTAVCSGGDAEVRVSLTQNGIPLAGRTVRFEVVSGDVRFITSLPGLAESLSISTTTSSDGVGIARTRIRVLSDATAQTSIIQITDTVSGFVQRAAVTIAPGSNAPLNAQPNRIVFQGVAANTCATGISADVIVFGGRPPYLISQPGSFEVSPTIVTQNGGRFSVKAIGQCAADSQIAVVDGNGATVSVGVTNSLSDVVATPTPTPTTTSFSVSPGFVTLTSCTDASNVLLIGGSGAYIAASGSPSILATTNGGSGVIRRQNGPAPGASSFTVSFSDGKTSNTVFVTLAGEALGTCPPSSTPSAQSPVLNPPRVTLNSCSDIVNVSVTGGSGSYTVARRTTALDIGGFTNFFSVRRSPGTAVTTPTTLFIDVFDGQSVTTLPVDVPTAASC